MSIPKLDPLKLPPQTGVLTTADAKQRMVNFKKLMLNFYKDESGKIPRGTFIPLDDLSQIVSMAKTITSITEAGTTLVQPINIVGVRAYFTFPLPELEVLGPGNKIDAEDYPVDLILVPVYQHQKDTSVPGVWDKNELTYDLVAPVTAKTKSTEIVDEKSSIYDITQPCPKLCDTDKTLY
ncbi:hypothetical protein [Ferruginibacter sp. HRS2-29]|uniref:hypothetical protein n=1 Tax=Ferruginibacter sp. HRS2-29 TaxID=2487334 RepID=UPI0020CCA2A9|nr:hypothetical protein [Ferruginibacter sp. HRS2-29]MCP9752340.1 hypothetical protein [Ferruginibacter sp. HRS2-29]